MKEEKKRKKAEIKILHILRSAYDTNKQMHKENVHSWYHQVHITPIKILWSVNTNTVNADVIEFFFFFFFVQPPSP